MSKTFNVLKALGVVSTLWLTAACAPPPSASKDAPIQLDGVALSNEAIYQDYEYNAKRPGAIRWETQGSTFTALETASGFESAVLEKDQYGDDIKIYEEIVQYDPGAEERTVLIGCG